jgi:hypothetical protein
MLGRQPRLLEVLRPRLKACASLWLLLIHARQSRACGAERLRQRRRLMGDVGFVIEFGGGLLSGYVSHVSRMYRACISHVS